MIASGEKKEEYRKITLYWQKRLLRCGFTCNGNCVLAGEVVCPACRYLEYAKYDAVTFTLGYPRADDTSRRMNFAAEDICFKIDELEPFFDDFDAFREAFINKFGS